MKKNILNRYHSWNYCFIFLVLTVIPLQLSAQNKTEYRNYKSVYVSKGMEKIANNVSRNGWVNFNLESKIKAKDCFREHKKLFGLNDNDEMILKKSVSDNLGFSHNRYHQYYKGLKVEFSEIVLHEKDGTLHTSSGKVIPGINISIIPSITSKKAYHLVSESLNDELKIASNHEKSSLKLMESELVILPKSDKFNITNDYLAYKLTVYNEIPLYGAAIYVDAHSGKTLFVSPKIVNVNSTGTAVTLYSGKRTIITDKTGNNTFKLRDFSRDANIYMWDMDNGENFMHANYFIDNDNYWTPADAAYDVLWGMEQCLDYFQSSFGRNSYDNAGGHVECYVHYGKDFVNARWDPINGYFIFGDGDGGVRSTELTSLDIVGHEFTHALTQYSADLVYANEPGALNESFSDIFGTVIEYFIKPNSANWIMGDEAVIDSRLKRSMKNPKSLGAHASNLINCQYSPGYYSRCIDKMDDGQPDTYKGNYWLDIGNYTPLYGIKTGNDYGGVHINSGVQNYWFYLLSEGGTGTNDNNETYNVKGIGIDKAAAIAYRNLAVYLTSDSDFADARQGSIEAACDLFGKCSDELTQVIKAWDAVGVKGPVNVATNAYACGNIKDGTIYVASNNIYAGSNCSGNTTTIDMLTTAVFRAGNAIYIKKGFHAKKSSNFKAQILNCGGGVIKSTDFYNNVTYTDTYTLQPSDKSGNNYNSENSFSFYPNPVSELLYVDYRLASVNQATIQIINLVGKVIKVVELDGNSNKLELNVGDLSAGIYIIQMKVNNAELHSKKLIIK